MKIIHLSWESSSFRMSKKKKRKKKKKQNVINKYQCQRVNAWAICHYFYFFIFIFINYSFILFSYTMYKITNLC